MPFGASSCFQRARHSVEATARCRERVLSPFWVQRVRTNTTFRRVVLVPRCRYRLCGTGTGSGLAARGASLVMVMVIYSALVHRVLLQVYQGHTLKYYSPGCFRSGKPVRKGTLVGRLVKQVVIHTGSQRQGRTHKQANGTRVFAVVPACVYMYRVSPKRPGVSVYGISAMRREAIRVRLDLPEH